MNRRTIILYGLILLVPTLVIGVVAFHLLSHEQERIDQAARSSARDRARVIAETLQVTVEAVEDKLAEELRHIPRDRLEQTLLEWEQYNPLARNVFIWQKGFGLQYPRPGRAAVSEEKRFIARYNALFSGRLPWHTARADARDPSSPKTVGSNAGAQSFRGVDSEDQPGLIREIRKFKTVRHELENMAKGGVKHHKSGRGSNIPAQGAGGWIPWFEENRLYILGWVLPGPDDTIYGIELELMTLLSRLVTDFPDSPTDSTVYALLDGSGRILHQAGTATLEEGMKPDITVSLAPQLPHWYVGVYFTGGLLPVQSVKGFLLLSGLLLAIFIVTIISGGSLLMWQVHRNMRDARQKTSFVSNVSHELKTPLTSIRMYAELLNEGRIKDPEKKKRYLQVIVDESQRLTRLVNNVLDFSRLEQGRKKYHLEELEMTGYLLEIVEFHHLRIQEAGMVLEVHVPDESIVIKTDRDAIEQVILNLIDNAIKYAADGGELVIALKVIDGHCEIRFMDRGPGVPPAHRSSIFEKFHRIDDSLTSQQPGSGLGLSIARRFLTDLDGDLLFEPRGGGGSCFVVLVPCQSHGNS